MRTILTALALIAASPAVADTLMILSTSPLECHTRAMTNALKKQGWEIDLPFSETIITVTTTHVESYEQSCILIEANKGDGFAHFKAQCTSEGEVYPEDFMLVKAKNGSLWWMSHEIEALEVFLCDE